MENNRIKTGLVIMASGLGKRFGSNKLMESLGDKPLIKWVIDASEGLFDERVVVTRSEDVFKLCKNIGIKCIFHEFPGRNDTVRLGLSALMNDIDYCFFMQGDQPLISKESIDNMIMAANINNNLIVKASFNDVVGAPMGFPRKFFDDLLNLPDGKGGNFVAKNNADSVENIEVSNEYELYDIDTKEDLNEVINIVRTLNDSE